MKTLTRIASLAAVACALAVSKMQAQVIISPFTNDVTFSAVFIQQGTNGLHHGTNTSYAPPKVSSFDTANLISEISTATGTNFSKAAKLVVIDPDNGRFPYFAMIDGTNYMDISSIMTLNNPDLYVSVFSGPDSGPGLQKSIQWQELDFADTNLPNGTLEFKLRGLASYASTYTAPGTNHFLTLTAKAKISSMTGDGLSGTNQFMATGTMSLSGKGPLQVSP